VSNLTVEAIVAKKSFKVMRYKDRVELWFPTSVKYKRNKPTYFKCKVLIKDRNRKAYWSSNSGEIEKFIRFHDNKKVKVLSIEEEQLLLELLD
jgi:hypothetical protein